MRHTGQGAGGQPIFAWEKSDFGGTEVPLQPCDSTEEAQHNREGSPQCT